MSRGKKRPGVVRPLTLRVRKSLGYSQDGFAKKVGVSKASVQNWERNRGRTKPENLQAIAALEGVPPELVSEIRSAIERFEYHLGPRDEVENVPPTDPVALLPSELREAIAVEAKRNGKNLADYYVTLIQYGWKHWLKELQASSGIPRARG